MNTDQARHMIKSMTMTLLMMLLSFHVQGQDNTYEILALRFATNGRVPISAIATGAATKDSVQVCYMFWLLRGKNGKNILVDAGFSDTTGLPNIKHIRPDLALARINVRPGDISDIIITHPHRDHIDGIDLFPGAMVWMQKDDYEYFVGMAWQKGGYTTGLLKKDVIKIVQRNLDKKLTLVKGDNLEILPGIKVFIGSKHTYESQYVLVDSNSDKVILASDNSWFYYNIENLLPIPMTFDSKGYLDNLKRMRAMVGKVDLVIPGHDPLVFARFPKVADDVVRIGN